MKGSNYKTQKLLAKIYGGTFYFNMSESHSCLEHYLNRFCFPTRIRTGGNKVADPNRISRNRNDSFACRSLPNLTDGDIADGGNSHLGSISFCCKSRLNSDVSQQSR